MTTSVYGDDARRWAAGRPSARWWPLGVLVWLGLAACAGPRAIDAPDLNVSDRQAEARALLSEPRSAARGHLELAWLCLLHGVDCAQLRDHSEAAVRGAEAMGLAQVTRALARQQLGAIEQRAAAWLDVLVWARWSQTGGRGRDDLNPGAVVTVAQEALARLARRDRVGVRLALQASPLDATQLVRIALDTRAPALRQRQLVALASWRVPSLAPSGGRATAGASTTAPLVAVVTPRLLQAEVRDIRGAAAPLRSGVSPAAPTACSLEKRPFGRRLYADLDRVGLGRQPTTRLPLAVSRVNAMDELTLPLPGPSGVYRAHLCWRDLQPGRWQLTVWSSRAGRLWLDKTPQRLPQQRAWRGAADVGVDGDLSCTIALPLAREGERLRVALLRTREPARTAAEASETSEANRPTSRSGFSAQDAHRRLVRRVIQALLGPTRPQGARRDSPLAALLALDRDGDDAGRRRALDHALDAFPNHVDARLARARIARGDSQVGLARRLLRPVTRRARRERALARRADVQFALVGMRQLEGLGDLAVAAAERAARAQRGNCRVYWRAVEVASDSLARAALRRLLALDGAARCRARAPLRHAQLLAAVGRSADASRLLRATARRPGWARRARAAARALPGGERARWAWSTATQAAKAARRAAQALVRGDTTAAKHAWSQILCSRGASATERRGAWLLGAAPPWQGLTIDGAAWLRSQSQQHTAASKPSDAAQRTPRAGRGAARRQPHAQVTWLLDHEIVVALPGGGALRRVHQIVRVHTAAAAEALGELTVAPDAELVLARTHTADGRVVSPADTPDKESLSLREVSPGAAVETVQVAFVEPGDAVTGATWLPVFLLRSRDGPVVESRYEVLDQPRVDGGRWAMRVDASAQAPAPLQLPHTTPDQGLWRLRRWRLRGATRFRLEPRANRAAWQVAAVRASSRATWASVVAPWADRLAAQAARRPAAQLRPWLARARRAGRDRARWRRLIAAVAGAVEHKRARLAPGDAAAAVRNGEGDRAALLLRLARAAGVRACLVRVQPWSRQPAYGAPDPADFRISALVLHLDSGGTLAPVWLDPGVDGALLNYLRPGLRRRPAVRVTCTPGPQAPKRAGDNATQPAGDDAIQLITPDLGADADRRTVAIDLLWRADGGVEATVQDTLRGVLAVVVRRVLQRGDRDQRAAVLRQLSSASFPGLTATWLPDRRDADADASAPQRAQDAQDAPLVLRYRVRGEAAGHRRTRLMLGLTPYRLGRRYATLGQRKMPLRFGHHLNVALTLRVRSDGGLIRLPRAAHVRAPHVRLQQRVVWAPQKGSESGGDQRSDHGRERRALRLEHHLRTQMGLVGPAAYPAFARALRRVDHAEMLILRRISAPTTAQAERRQRRAP